MTPTQDIKIPDIGGATGVDVIEILIKAGDVIDIDTPLVILESDKASMEIPSPVAGVVREVKVKSGDKVSEGDVIFTLEANTAVEVAVTAPAPQAAVSEESPPPPRLEKEEIKPVEAIASQEVSKDEDATVFAGPGARRLARTLGVSLAHVQGTGRKDRISRSDVEQFVKKKLTDVATSHGSMMPTAPAIDFSQYGEIDIKPMNKIKRLTGQHVHRSWVTVPHVTQFDDADITDLEAFRKSEMEHTQPGGCKLTVLAFVCKAISHALQQFPQFNSSLSPHGDEIIYKKYCHIGIAVETPNGLVVPVIKHVNHLSVREIALEMTRLSTKAREKGLMPSDMSGGCFTISSLGGIGGRAFTPIVNSPEVAILGLSRANLQPVYQKGEWVPRLMLPLSLSYDHRVIDGAEGARFTRFVGELLSDIRRMVL